jgi:hypothetical protein
VALQLVEPDSLEVVVHHEGSTPRRALEAWLLGLLQELSGGAPDELRLEVSGPNQLRARVPVQPKQLDRGIRWLAAAIEDAAFLGR